MPQLLGIVVLGAALWYGYKVVKREMVRVSQEVREAEQRAQTEQKTLIKGSDGVYRPSDKI